MVDYSDKDNFVHFGSAESLLERFVYRVFTKKGWLWEIYLGMKVIYWKNWTKVR